MEIIHINKKYKFNNCEFQIIIVPFAAASGVEYYASKFNKYLNMYCYVASVIYEFRLSKLEAEGEERILILTKL